MILGKLRAREFRRVKGTAADFVNAVHPSGGMMGVVENEYLQVAMPRGLMAHFVQFRWIGGGRRGAELHLIIGI